MDPIPEPSHLPRPEPSTPKSFPMDFPRIAPVSPKGVCFLGLETIFLERELFFWLDLDFGFDIVWDALVKYEDCTSDSDCGRIAVQSLGILVSTKIIVLGNYTIRPHGARCSGLAL